MGLSVCPHCGRDVHPAGPRWALWAAGLAVVVLIALWGLGKLPDQVVGEVASLRTRVASIVQVFGPAESSSGSENPPVPTPESLAQAPEKDLPTSTPSDVPSPTKSAPVAEVEAVPATAVAEAATQGPTSTEAPTETPTPTTEPTATPSATPTATPSPEPTATPTNTPTETPTQPPAPTGQTIYKVKSGDTLSGIAERYGIAWQDLASANGLTSRSTLRAGQELVVPVPGAPAPPASGQGTAPTTYTVKSGDNLSTIAAQFGMTWQTLATANGLNGSSRLRVGQVLVIPGTGGPVQPTPAPAATSTAAPTEQAAPVSPAQLPAPRLVSPGDQTPFSGSSAFIELVWAPLPDLPNRAQYQVLLQWTEQGAPMEYSDLHTTGASIRMPLWLFGKADQPARQYLWSVRVVEQTTDGEGRQRDILLSPSSALRTLYWN